MNPDLPDILNLLDRTPSVLDALLRGTSAAWHNRRDAPDTWSAFDVVGHLVHGEETDWIQRARIVLEHGESRAFEPFDRFAQFESSVGKSIEQLLDRFAELRRTNLVLVRGWNLTEAQLLLVGRHPALDTVTLGQLLTTWVVHDLDHLAQISRVLARRHTDGVGPWRAYLPILTR